MPIDGWGWSWDCVWLTSSDQLFLPKDQKKRILEWRQICPWRGILIISSISRRCFFKQQQQQQKDLLTLWKFNLNQSSFFSINDPLFPSSSSILLRGLGGSLTFFWRLGKIELSWSVSWPFILRSPVWILCCWVLLKIFWWLIQQLSSALLSVAAEWVFVMGSGEQDPRWTQPTPNYSLRGIKPHSSPVCECVYQIKMRVRGVGSRIFLAEQYNILWLPETGWMPTA